MLSYSHRLQMWEGRGDHRPTWGDCGEGGLQGPGAEPQAGLAGPLGMRSTQGGPWAGGSLPHPSPPHTKGQEAEMVHPSESRGRGSGGAQQHRPGVRTGPPYTRRAPRSSLPLCLTHVPWTHPQRTSRTHRGVLCHWDCDIFWQTSKHPADTTPVLQMSFFSPFSCPEQTDT